MEPLYTLLLCLPAALVLIACGCGVAVLRPPVAQAANSTRRGRGTTSVVEGEAK